MANTERENIAVKVGGFTAFNGGEELARTVFQRADFFFTARCILPNFRRVIFKARLQGKYILRRSDKLKRPIIIDLLLPQTFNIQSRARDEMLQAFACLRRTGKSGRAPRNRIGFAVIAYFTRRHSAASGAGIGKIKWLAIGFALFCQHAHHLRNNISGTLNNHAVANANIFTRYLIGIVQSGVRDHHTTNGYWHQLGDRRQRTGAPDLNIDII